MYIYPIAFGPPAPGPRDVGMSGCLVVWLFGCLVVWLFGCLVGWLDRWLVGCEIQQVGGRNLLSLALKTTKLEAKIV